MPKPKVQPPRSRFAAVKVTDANITVGSPLYDRYHRDRYTYDRHKLVEEAIKAYRLNPLIRRIVKLYRMFSIGSNVSVDVIEGGKPAKFARSKKSKASNFIQAFWKHPVNNLDEQIPEWFDERTLTGNLFILFSVDPSGMPLVRAIPGERITEVQTRDNDYRQEVAYLTGIRDDDEAYKAYDPSGELAPPFVRHYVINRPVGSTFGESDLFPILPWISRHNSLLENRVNLNFYRTIFSWVLSGNFANEAERQAREKQLQACPPRANSILVKKTEEEWSTLSPRLDSYEAQADILAIKKNIAAGAGIPLHFLAEPESTTRTTAEAAGTPTFKNFADYQQSFFNILRDVLSIACTLRRSVDASVPANPEFVINGQDISERDNSILALALQRAADPLGDMFDRHMIDTKEYLRLVYKFAGEVYDEEKDQSEGLRRPLSQRSKPNSSPQPLPRTEAESGDVQEER